MRAGGGKAERVAVGRRLGDHVGADIAARPWAVVDNELLAEPRIELVADDAGRDVGAAASRERHDNADRPIRPFAGLRWDDAGGECRSHQGGDESNHRCSSRAKAAIISERSFSALNRGCAAMCGSTARQLCR
jgi:hypothetical protein